MAELKQALGDLGFGSRAQAAAEDMVREAAGKGVGSITQADFLQFFRRVCCSTWDCQLYPQLQTDQCLSVVSCGVMDKVCVADRVSS